MHNLAYEKVKEIQRPKTTKKYASRLLSIC